MHFSRAITTFHGREAPEEAELVGYGAVIDTLALPLPLPDTLSLIGSRHKLYSTKGWKVYTPRHKPSDSLYGHLVFALKYEGVNLLFFKKLFDVIGREGVETLIRSQPNGQYSRRVWFLYEWLMPQPLDVPDLKNGNYVELLNENLQYTLKKSVNVPRQRIRNNLPGTIDFCPLIFKSVKLEEYIDKNLEQETYEMLASIRQDILLRISAFLILKDSKSSFSIEGESPSQTRASDWGKAIAQAGSKELSSEEFLRLQQMVLGDTKKLKLGFRKQNGFVGEHDKVTGAPKPDHISARWEDLDSLLSGLLEAAKLMTEKGYHPVLIAASIAFGFVFIHPFIDGNGRIHRYIIHHLLARNKFSPEGMIFPVSAAILERIGEYQAVLEHYSRPILPFIEWAIAADNNVEVKNETTDYYRFFDATKQAEFLFDCIAYTMENIIPNGIKQLENRDTFKTRLNDDVLMSDKKVELVIKFLEQNEGRLSRRAVDKEFDELEHEQIQLVEEQYKEIFKREQPVRYSIVIRPPADIIEKVKGMKNALKQAIGGFFNSVNSEAHITLFEFHAYENDYPLLLKEFRKVIGGLDPFDIKLDGFKHFPTNGAFYIQPTIDSSKEIVAASKKFKEELNSKFLKELTEGWMELFKVPHMSIGRKLQPEWIEIAYSLFTEFKAEFRCDRITIRKFNSNRRQFDVIDELPMLGKGFASDNQLNLF
ncbi:2'-5' RNA ligase family protein [Dyadobacter sp. Leaf189]|uniref:2'-5' RNA ligase family protein n=1 Tax=Dyadobacter sp. Leaf189 TaxID=1736295 RepID=UPI0009EAFCBC|nr:2'-5' RNA ligase family protein [Dyadobacter sp. Leaf189]